LSWEFFDTDPGDFQSAYQVQVDNNSDFSSPEKDSEKVSSSSYSYVPIKLSYNTTHYWRVRVWDSKDAPSEWTIGSSFTTPAHAYPQVDFYWIPLSPAVDELVEFTDSTIYDNGAFSWNWNFGDGNTSTEQNPTHSYTDTQPGTVILQACDNIPFCCSDNKDIKVSLPLPKWKEIAPF
jgi:PKD repeat protein